MSTFSHIKSVGDCPLHQRKGPKGAPEVAAEMLRKDLNKASKVFLHPEDTTIDLSITGADCTKLEPMIASDSSTSGILIGSEQACHQRQLKECLEAMESVHGGLEGIQDEVKRAFKEDRWGAMLNMTEAILHSESYAMHASERPDFRNTDGPDPSDKSKWLDVVKLLSFSSDSTVEEKEAVDKEMEKELRPLDLTPRPFPLETIDLYRKIIVMLPDVDPNTGKELKELKRSATFSDEILCALFVETFTCCKPRRCLQIEHPDHAEDCLTDVGWSSDLLASDDGDYHSVSEA